MKNKRGISIMIGYILLISVAVFMGIVIYGVLKTYIPTNTPECPSDVSIAIQEAKCNNGKLELKLENNGLFTINGYFLKAKTNNNSKISTVDLGEATKDGLVLFSPSLEPEKISSNQSFDYDSTICSDIGGDCVTYLCNGHINCEDYGQFDCSGFGLLFTNNLCSWDPGSGKCVSTGNDCDSLTYDINKCADVEVIINPITMTNECSTATKQNYPIYSIEVIPFVATRDENGKLTSMVCSDSRTVKNMENCRIIEP